MFDHREARPAGTGEVIRGKPDPVLDSIADQRCAMGGERGHQDFALAGGAHVLVDDLEDPRKRVDMHGAVKALEYERCSLG
ncbi:hypothetical protein D3C71_1627240 [compost metagenome]